ncbi:MAG: hypothetical protein IPM47_04005 [Sphingobacteriales bacterium]|nr:MAG: hypothetical protein IPM47_04005 [Sphingobacteriales bacterium]
MHHLRVGNGYANRIGNAIAGGYTTGNAQAVHFQHPAFGRRTIIETYQQIDDIGSGFYIPYIILARKAADDGGGWRIVPSDARMVNTTSQILSWLLLLLIGLVMFPISRQHTISE